MCASQVLHLPVHQLSFMITEMLSHAWVLEDRQPMWVPGQPPCQGNIPEDFRFPPQPWHACLPPNPPAHRTGKPGRNPQSHAQFGQCGDTL